jgi:hypothetical protein
MEDDAMTGYSAVFYKIDGLDEKLLEPHYGLNATSRDEAEIEALELPRPEGANFVRLFRDGLFEAPEIGFAL